MSEARIIIFPNWLFPAQSGTGGQLCNAECRSHHILLVFPTLIKHMVMHKYLE